MSCRTTIGWSASCSQIEKGSACAQIGAELTDVVLLVMNERGVERLLQDKVTPRCRCRRSSTAATDAQSGARCSRIPARGLFAGIDLLGGVWSRQRRNRDFAWSRRRGPRNPARQRGWPPTTNARRIGTSINHCKLF